MRLGWSDSPICVSHMLIPSTPPPTPHCRHRLEEEDKRDQGAIWSSKIWDLISVFLYTFAYTLKRSVCFHKASLCYSLLCCLFVNANVITHSVKNATNLRHKGITLTETNLELNLRVKCFEEPVHERADELPNEKEMRHKWLLSEKGRCSLLRRSLNNTSCMSEQGQQYYLIIDTTVSQNIHIETARELSTV